MYDKNCIDCKMANGRCDGGRYRWDNQTKAHHHECSQVTPKEGPMTYVVSAFFLLALLAFIALMVA